MSLPAAAARLLHKAAMNVRDPRPCSAFYLGNTAFRARATLGSNQRPLPCEGETSSFAVIRCYPISAFPGLKLGTLAVDVRHRSPRLSSNCRQTIACLGSLRHRSLPLIRPAVTIPSASGEQDSQWRLHRSGVYASASHASDGYRVHWQRSQQMGLAPSPRTRIQKRRRRMVCPQRNENAPWRSREGSPTTALVSYLPLCGGDRLSI